MATVTSIDAVLTAHTGKFDAGMIRGQRGLQRFRREVDFADSKLGRFHSRMSGWAGKVIALAGAYIGARAALHAFNESADRLDKMAKTGDTLGATTEELQAFTRSAGLSGVEVEAMTKGLGFMERAIGKTKIGTEAMQESAKQAFKNIGIDVAELEGMTLSEKFGKVSEKLNGMATQEEKLAAGAQIFGRNIAELLPFIDAGSAGINESREFMRRYGIELSRLDVAKVEMMNDTWSDVWLVLKGILDKALVKFAPLINEIGESILALADNMDGFADAIDSAFEGANDWIKWWGKSIAEVGETISSLIAKMYELKAITMEKAAGEGSFITTLAAQLTGMEDDFLAEATKSRGMAQIAEANSKMWADKAANFDKDWDNRLKEAEEKAKQIAEKGKGRRGRGFDDEMGFGGPGGGAAVGAPRVAQRGSAESLAIINQMNRQKTMGDMIADAFKETMMEWSEKEMAMVEVTHTILGDTNKHLEKIADAATEEPGDAI